MKISLVQYSIKWEDKKANIKKACEIISNNKGSDLILFPEMSFTGFSMNTVMTKEKDDSTVNHLSEAAQQNGVAIGFGWVKDCGEKCENHYTVVDGSGNIVSDFAKIHPFSYAKEDVFFQGGDKLSVFKLEGVWFSTFICYDLRFPEVFRALPEKVSAVIVPAAWPEARRNHWKTLLKARAIENQVYMIGVNYAGEIGGLRYAGDSCIVDSNGKLLDGREMKGEVVHFDFVNDTELIRTEFPLRADRRADVYKRILM